MAGTTLSTATATGAAFSSVGQNSAENQTYSVLKASSAVLYKVAVDNTAGAGTVYEKLYDSATPTVGTDGPEVIIPALAGQKTVVTFAKAGGSGGSANFGTALSAACVQEKGTAGTTAPAASVITTIAYT